MHTSMASALISYVRIGLLADPEMKVHVLAALAFAVLFVFFECVLHVHGEHAPHGGCRQLQSHRHMLVTAFICHHLQ